MMVWNYLFFCCKCWFVLCLVVVRVGSCVVFSFNLRRFLKFCVVLIEFDVVMIVWWFDLRCWFVIIDVVFWFGLWGYFIKCCFFVKWIFKWFDSGLSDLKFLRIGNVRVVCV